MITKKQLKEEILTYDIITYTTEDGEEKSYVEVILADRIIEVNMDIREVNIGLIANAIMEQGLYK